MLFTYRTVSYRIKPLAQFNSSSSSRPRMLITRIHHVVASSFLSSLHTSMNHLPRPMQQPPSFILRPNRPIKQPALATCNLQHSISTCIIALLKSGLAEPRWRNTRTMLTDSRCRSSADKTDGRRSRRDLIMYYSLQHFALRSPYQIDDELQNRKKHSNSKTQDNIERHADRQADMRPDANSASQS
jgi:hypothetical protein